MQNVKIILYAIFGLGILAMNYIPNLTGFTKVGMAVLLIAALIGLLKRDDK